MGIHHPLAYQPSGSSLLTTYSCLVGGLFIIVVSLPVIYFANLAVINTYQSPLFTTRARTAFLLFYHIHFFRATYFIQEFLFLQLSDDIHYQPAYMYNSDHCIMTDNTGMFENTPNTTSNDSLVMMQNGSFSPQMYQDHSNVQNSHQFNENPRSRTRRNTYATASAAGRHSGPTHRDADPVVVAAAATAAAATMNLTPFPSIDPSSELSLISSGAYTAATTIANSTSTIDGTFFDNFGLTSPLTSHRVTIHSTRDLQWREKDIHLPSQRVSVKGLIYASLLVVFATNLNSQKTARGKICFLRLSERLSRHRHCIIRQRYTHSPYQHQLPSTIIMLLH